MKLSRFTDSQIIAILKQAEGGSPVPELCPRETGWEIVYFHRGRASGQRLYFKYGADAKSE